MRSAPAPLADVLEKDWDAQLFNSKEGLATMTGWSSYHTLRSKGSQSGFPDRTLFRDRVIFAELKREKTNPTDNQVFWLDGLARAGAEVYVWKPGDLEEIGLILSKHWRFVCWTPERPPHLVRDFGTPFEPLSLWIPGEGRKVVPQ